MNFKIKHPYPEHQPITPFSERELHSLELRTKVLDFVEFAALNLSLRGVGVAAPQVGIFERFCCVFDPETKVWTTAVNPVITKRSGPETFKVEGCLSFPGKEFWVKRSEIVTVQYFKFDYHLEEPVFTEETAAGFKAQIYSHEIGHLDGETYNWELREMGVDKMKKHFDPKMPKPGRNDECPCKSGKKYKRCCIPKYG